MWNWTDLKGPAYCGRVAREDNVELSVTEHEDGSRRAGLRGALTCSSIAACPVCSATVRQRRALEVRYAAREHVAAGGRLLMLTLTLRHSKSDRLDQLLEQLMAAWRATTEGRPFGKWRDRLGLSTWVRALEVLDGDNGWHPHLHVLLFIGRDTQRHQLYGPVHEPERLELIGPPGPHRKRMGTVATFAENVPVSDDLRDSFAGWIDARWRVKLAEVGADALPGVGSDLLELDGEAAGYVAKVQGERMGTDRLALEVARADLKSGRTGSRAPFELLDDVDNERDKARWLEYEAATKGRRMLERGTTFAQLFGLADLEDADLTGDDAADDLERLEVATIPLTGHEWSSICARGWSWDALMFAVADPSGVTVRELARRAVKLCADAAARSDAARRRGALASTRGGAGA